MVRHVRQRDDGYAKDDNNGDVIRIDDGDNSEMDGTWVWWLRFVMGVMRGLTMTASIAIAMFWLLMTWGSGRVAHGGNRVDVGGMEILVSSADVDDGDSGGVVDGGINAVKAAVFNNDQSENVNADGDNILTCVTTRQATTTRTYLVMLIVLMLMLMKIF
eukprot:scaffold21691_cov21-Prasinocladus_malaysianus.AAC.1